MSCVECGDPITAADRKYSGPCTHCGALTCPKHTHFYVDESNGAITLSSRPYCIEHAGEAS